MRIGDGRGGGVSVIYKNTCIAIKEPTVKFNSFEHIEILLNCKSDLYRVIVIYRPQTQFTISDFYDEFEQFICERILLSGELVIVGDFNIHLELSSNMHATRFLDILEEYGLHQQVKGPTHRANHTLDLVITRNQNKGLVIVIEEPLMSDHKLITFCLHSQRPSAPKENITFRRLKSIDVDKFCQDMHCLLAFDFLYWWI